MTSTQFTLSDGLREMDVGQFNALKSSPSSCPSCGCVFLDPSFKLQLADCFTSRPFLCEFKGKTGFDEQIFFRLSNNLLS